MPAVDRSERLKEREARRERVLEEGRARRRDALNTRALRWAKVGAIAGVLGTVVAILALAVAIYAVALTLPK